MVTPNFDHWDHETEFSLQVAAALCCNLQPESWTHSVKYNPLPPEVGEMMGILKREVPFRDERKPAGSTQGRRGIVVHYGASGAVYFTRANLRAWADRTGRRLPFLYPEDRSDANGDRIRADTKESLLLMIALLSRALVEKSGPRAGTPEDPTKDFLVKQIRAEAEACKFEGSGLSPSNLQARLKEAFGVLRDLSKVRT